MATKNIPENNEKFYTLFKELLETQSTIIKNQAEQKEMLKSISEKINPQESKSTSDAWETM